MHELPALWSGVQEHEKLETTKERRLNTDQEGQEVPFIADTAISDRCGTFY
jgi:hypothetical protein